VTTIGRNRALDLLRSKGRRPVLSPGSEEMPERVDRATAESEVLALVSTEEALRLIATLPQDQAEAVLLRAVMGLDAKTAARVLGKQPGAVRTAAYRGLITLRRKFQAEE
jgi:RNA polymerase sigma-70 factor (ECF subfamily)